MNCVEITDYLKSLCGPPLPGDPLGYLHGDGQADCTGAACVWQATAAALELAAESGLNLVITHEALWIRFQESGWYPDTPADDKPMNRRLTKALADGGIHVFRAHSAWDNAPNGNSVPDQCAAALGWNDLHALSQFLRVYRIPPTRLGWLGELVGQAMARDFGHGAGRTRPRVFGDPTQMVERVGLAIGGFGGNQVNMPYHLADLGAQAIVCGDMIEHFAAAAADCGLGVIETLHSWTEEHAIRRQARLLRDQFPGLRVMYWPTGIETFWPVR